MSRSVRMGFFLSVAFTLAAVAADNPEPTKSAAGPALERLKKLQGTWVAADKDGKPTEQVVSIFKITSGGSAVHETIFPGQPHEMVTVYHLDGKDLVLTHYCAIGNQPRMKLDPQSPQNELHFKFAGGSNLDPAKDMHMHEGSIKFSDDGRIQWNWQSYQDGKPVDEHKVSMTLVRKPK